MPANERKLARYSVYRREDDRLMILDGTAKECSRVLGINVNSFHGLLCKTYRGNKWVIIRSDPEEIRRDMES